MNKFFLHPNLDTTLTYSQHYVYVTKTGSRQLCKFQSTWFFDSWLAVWLSCSFSLTVYELFTRFDSMVNFSRGYDTDKIFRLCCVKLTQKKH